jgi:hypothetical protein
MEKKKELEQQKILRDIFSKESDKENPAQAKLETLIRYWKEKSVNLGESVTISTREYNKMLKSLSKEEKERFDYYMDKFDRITAMLQILNTESANYQINIRSLRGIEMVRRTIEEHTNILNDLLSSIREDKKTYKKVQDSLSGKAGLYFHIVVEKDGLITEKERNTDEEIKRRGKKAVGYLQILKAIFKCYDDFVKKYDCRFIYEEEFEFYKDITLYDWALFNIHSGAEFKRIEKENPKLAERIKDEVIYPDYESVEPTKGLIHSFKKILNEKD